MRLRMRGHLASSCARPYRTAALLPRARFGSVDEQVRDGVGDGQPGVVFEPDERGTGVDLQAPPLAVPVEFQIGSRQAKAEGVGGPLGGGDTACGRGASRACPDGRLSGHSRTTWRIAPTTSSTLATRPSWDPRAPVRTQ